MRWLVAALLVFVASAQDSMGDPPQPSGEALRHAPPDAPFMPAQAVDHVVAMFESDGGRDQIIVTRSGDWQREERVRSDEDDGGTRYRSRWISYSNVATGVSITLSYEDDGGIGQVFARRF